MVNDETYLKKVFIDEVKGSLKCRLGLDNALSDAIRNSASGDSIVVKDSAESKLRGLRVFGKTEQFTTTGAQLFDASTIVATDNAVTLDITDDGYKIIATSNTLTNLYANARTEIEVDSVRGKTIYVQHDSLTRTDGSNGCVQLVVTNADGTMTYKPLYTSTTSLSHTIPNDAIKVELEIYTNNGTDGLEEFPTITVLGLRLGFAETEWEPYTGGIPSPNPQYPQELVSVGDDGDVEVEVYGKNLWNPENVIRGLYMGGGKLDLTDEATIVFIECKPNTTYTVSKKAGERFFACYTYEFPTRNSVAHGEIGNNTGKSITITTDEYAKYFVAYVHLSTKDTISLDEMLASVQIEVGATVTPYEPYKAQQTLTIPTPNGFPGIPVTDASLATYTDENGQMWCADEVNFERGVYVKRVGTVEVNPSKIDYSCDVDYAICSEPINANVSLREAALCTHFKYGARKNWVNCTSASAYTEEFVFTMQERFDGRQYRCLVSDVHGNKVTTEVVGLYCGTQETDTVTLSIQKVSETGIKITRQPEDVWAEVYSQASFKVEAEGEGLSYQWQYSLDGKNYAFWVDSLGESLCFGISGFTSTDEYRNYFTNNKVVVVYPLLTPIETPLTAEELTAYQALHSNYPVTMVLNDEGVHMEVKYKADTKNYIDNKFAELQTALVALGGI